jgi:hypothetical protein
MRLLIGTGPKSEKGIARALNCEGDQRQPPGLRTEVLVWQQQ